jgi:hypothetical protein
MTAEQAYPAIRAIIEQMRDPAERNKLEKKILGAVESFQTRKAKIAAELDLNPRYQIRPPRKTKSK